VVVAFLLVASCFRLPAARVPGRVRLLQVRHLAAAAAAAAAAVVAEVAERARPAFFLVGRALHPHFLHQPEARPAAELRTVDRREVVCVQLRPEVTACRTADAQVLPGYPAAKSVLRHHVRDLAAQLVVAVAAGHVAAAATVRLLNLTAVLLWLRRQDRAREIARLV